MLERRATLNPKQILDLILRSHQVTDTNVLFRQRTSLVSTLKRPNKVLALTAQTFEENPPLAQISLKKSVAGKTKVSAIRLFE